MIQNLYLKLIHNEKTVHNNGSLDERVKKI